MAVTRYVSASGASLVVHVLFALVVMWLPWGSSRRALGPSIADGASAMIVTTAEASSAAASESRGPSATPAAGTESLEGLAESPSSEFHVPGFAFDFRKVAERARSLFPFLTRPLPLDRRASASRAASGISLFGIPLPRAVGNKPPLVMTDAALQGVIDQAWARRDRWIAFRAIVSLLEAHDADSERLAAVVQAYLDQNMLQPYVDTTIRDPRLWTMLGVAADSVDFVEFVEDYASRHPGTRAATELLFLLDELAQGNHDGLATLLGTNPERDLWWTRNAREDAYALIVRIQQHYREALERRGISRASALRGYYDEVRLAILTQIVRTTPAEHRANDARFLIGSIYWRQGQTSPALRWWREITPREGDSYAVASADVLDVLEAADPGQDRVAAARIDGILAAEHRRWLEFSTRRLGQFGFAVDEF